MASVALAILAGFATVHAARAAGQGAGTSRGACPGAGGAQDHALLQRSRTLAPVRRALGQLDQASACHTLLEGEPCYDEVLWATVHGIFDYPQWYPAPLSPASSFEDFQAHIFSQTQGRCPRPCERKAPVTAGERCVSRALKLDFFHSSVSHRNLGGLGPDAGAENMRYSHVGNRTIRVGDALETRPFDLVITAGASYQYHRQERNGLAGSYGIVNLKAPSSVDLTFTFEDSASGEPVVPEAFHFSMFDIDQSRAAQERMLIGGFERYTMDPASEIAVEIDTDGRTLFKSTRLGKGCDNPRDPLDLGEITCGGQTVDQRKRAVTFLFSNRSSFDVRLEATCGRRRCGGRNFLFAGSSSLSYSCEEAVQPGLCAAFGDPHFVTFDGAHTVLMAHQSAWLVRSQRVWMQALSKDSDGKLQGFAAGGPFMRNHTLVVRRTARGNLNVTFSGTEILRDTTDEFSVPGIMEGHRRPTWNATLHNNDVLAVRTQIRFSVGPWPERFLAPVGGLYLFKLPGDVEVTVTGVDFMSVVITMPPQEGGQAGYCGDFDGDANDDFERVSPSFHKPRGDHLGTIDPSELLFEPSDLRVDVAGWTAATAGAALQQDPQAVMRSCGAELLEMARTRCRVVGNARMREDCVFDICATGLVSAADGVLAAEILEEKVNARGIPLFVGQGRCLDTISQDYAAFNTTLVAASDCTDVLRSLALTGGVLGAQLHEAWTCQILVEQGVDPTSVPIRGGWGPLSNELSLGHGFISGSTGESGWTCWTVV